MEFAEVVVTAITNFFAVCHVVVTAIPAFAVGIPLIMVAAGAATMFAMDYWA